MKLLRRLFMISIVAGITYYAFMHYGPRVLGKKNPVLQKQTDNILGAATGLFNKGASASAKLVGGIVLKTATDPLIKEYAKLKPDQKEIIKKQICK